MSVHVIQPGDVPAEPPSEEPIFTILDVAAVDHAATPTLRFAAHVSDPAGREVYAIALSTQILIDPAQRTYDDETRARLVELFGAPERWAATTHAFQWARIDVLVSSFTGATSFEVEVPCTYDLEVAATKYFYSLPDGQVPLTFNFSGMVLYRGATDRMQIAPVPWSCSSRWRMPVEAWKRAIADQYPGGGWIHLTPETLEALRVRKAADGAISFNACVRQLLGEDG